MHTDCTCRRKKAKLNCALDESSSSSQINARKTISSEISIHRGSNIYCNNSDIFAPIYIQSILFNYTVSSGKPFIDNKGGEVLETRSLQITREERYTVN